jgi:hypothetical protein
MSSPYTDPHGQVPPGPVLLCVAHPGHELRVHGWLGLARPAVCVLTDGSGRNGESRLETTRALVGSAGAPVGPVFGRLRDEEAYAAILGRRAEVFIEIVDELSAHIRDAGILSVVGDAAEGYNPMHDVCRLILNATVALARREGRDIFSYAFPLVGAPDGSSERTEPGAVRVRLDDTRLEAKIAAARGYTSLTEDVEEALGRYGEDVFRVECLRPAPVEAGDGLPDGPPFYERHGERRVTEGKYPSVLRRHEHVLWLGAVLWRHAHPDGP